MTDDAPLLQAPARCDDVLVISAKRMCELARDFRIDLYIVATICQTMPREYQTKPCQAVWSREHWARAQAK
ncbi:hypothetical protein CYJ10_16535 [Cupriavidus pauculus]|uniref:Uncharacterized protein n=1 Tax=Cupriavidus pauculus TaxID=82633 RepID=A0A2N5CB48_9BURK|nr:hypothetical protein CYJ10_16535 [Cupriavidus pauculus]